MNILARIFVLVLVLSACLAKASGGTWEVLVLQVDERFLAPTLERGLAQDAEALTDAIEKLRLLAPDRGVVEYLHMEVAGGEPPFRQRAGGTTLYTPPPPGFRKEQVGREVLWENNGDEDTRVLFLNTIETPQQVFLTRMEFHHRLHNRWTLSAVVAWEGGGALLVVERLVGGEVEAVGGQAQWLFSELSDEKPHMGRQPSLHRSIVSAGKGRSVLLRFPDVEKTPKTVATSRHPSIRMIRTYLDRRRMDSSTWNVCFSAAPAEIHRVAETHYQRRGIVNMDLVFESGPSQAMVHTGKAMVPLPGEQAVSSFEAKVRETTVEAGTITERPTGKEKSYFLYGRVVEAK